MKIFGKELFKKKNVWDVLYETQEKKITDSKLLPDFMTLTAGEEALRWINNQEKKEATTVWALSEEDLEDIVDSRVRKRKKGKKKKETVKGNKMEMSLVLTPKGVYEMNTLNENDFTIKHGDGYIDTQIHLLKEKQYLIENQEGDNVKNNILEVSSMVFRLENRKQYKDHKEFYDQFPYTTSIKIADILKDNSNLKLGKSENFIANMPKEATKVMKEYTKETKKLCSKSPIFYLIADKKDFGEKVKKKDPILLAQSPFGHFWQILGAWDEEMILLENL